MNLELSVKNMEVSSRELTSDIRNIGPESSMSAGDSQKYLDSLIGGEASAGSSIEKSGVLNSGEGVIPSERSMNADVVSDRGFSGDPFVSERRSPDPLAPDSWRKDDVFGNFGGSLDTKDIRSTGTKPFEKEIKEAKEYLDNLIGGGSLEDVSPESYTFSLVPRSGGKWEGVEGNSRWRPDPEVVPGDRNGTNPEQQTWGDILSEYNIDSIPFKDGNPDFSEISRGTVEIDDFTDDRATNFAQADEKLAEQRGCSPEEVAKWRKENHCTWHELNDQRTMELVPTKVHGNIPHSGGISEYKSSHIENS